MRKEQWAAIQPRLAEDADLRTVIAEHAAMREFIRLVMINNEGKTDRDLANLSKDAREVLDSVEAGTLSTESYLA